MPPEALTTRQALEDAFEQHDSGTEDAVTAVDAHEEDMELDSHEEYEPGESEELEQPEPDTGELQEAEQPDDMDGEAESKSTEESELPPRGFSAAAREEWAKTPAAIRSEIAKREADYAKGIEQYRVQAQKGNSIDEVVTPYRQLFAQNGVSPPQMIGQLLQTAAILQGGNQRAKAELVSNMFQQFGVDVQMVDAMLAGEDLPQQGQPQSQGLTPEQVQQMLDQRLSQQREQEMVAESRSELEQFSQSPENEFYADVRGHMISIMEEAGRIHRPITLKECYDEACWANPQIRGILQQRAAQKNLSGKRKAGSSIRGSRGGSGDGGKPKTLRDTIAAAWPEEGRERI